MPFNTPCVWLARCTVSFVGPIGVDAAWPRHAGGLLWWVSEATCEQVVRVAHLELGRAGIELNRLRHAGTPRPDWPTLLPSALRSPPAEGKPAPASGERPTSEPTSELVKSVILEVAALRENESVATAAEAAADAALQEVIGISYAAVVSGGAPRQIAAALRLEGAWRALSDGGQVRWRSRRGCSPGAAARRRVSVYTRVRSCGES
jgi:hypothetical protein